MSKEIKMSNMSFLRARIPIIITGNGAMDIFLAVWGFVSAALGFGLIKSFAMGYEWREINPLNKIGAVAFVLYLVVVFSL